VEHAAARPTERREDDDEADRLVRDHGLSADRVIAFRGLARSRGVGLEEVLRHWLRGELRAVVALPPVHVRPDDEAQD
jgi:hypothetical protein